MDAFTCLIILTFDKCMIIFSHYFDTRISKWIFGIIYITEQLEEAEMRERERRGQRSGKRKYYSLQPFLPLNQIHTNENVATRNREIEREKGRKDVMIQVTAVQTGFTKKASS